MSDDACVPDEDARCELCGYRIDPLDSECRRCHGDAELAARLSKAQRTRDGVLATYFPGVTPEEAYFLVLALVVLPAIGVLGALLSKHVWATFWLLAFGQLPWAIGLLVSALHYTSGKEARRKLGRAGLLVAWLVFAIATMVIVRRVDIGIGGIGQALSPASGGRFPVFPGGAPAVDRDVECRLNKTWTTTKVGSQFMSISADSGKVYMVVNVTVVNNGDQELLIDEADFELVADDKNVYDPVGSMIWAGDSRISRLSAKLLPGGAATGDTVFEVAQAAKPVTIRYSPSMF